MILPVRVMKSARVVSFHGKAGSFCEKKIQTIPRSCLVVFLMERLRDGGGRSALGAVCLRAMFRNAVRGAAAYFAASI